MQVAPTQPVVSLPTNVIGSSTDLHEAQGRRPQGRSDVGSASRAGRAGAACMRSEIAFASRLWRRSRRRAQRHDGPRTRDVRPRFVRAHASRRRRARWRRASGTRFRAGSRALRRGPAAASAGSDHRAAGARLCRPTGSPPGEVGDAALHRRVEFRSERPERVHQRVPLRVVMRVVASA